MNMFCEIVNNCYKTGIQLLGSVVGFGNPSRIPKTSQKGQSPTSLENQRVKGQGDRSLVPLKRNERTASCEATFGGCFFYVGCDGTEIPGNITPGRYFSTLTGKRGEPFFFAKAMPFGTKTSPGTQRRFRNTAVAGAIASAS
jgi:hypothetical protein